MCMGRGTSDIYFPFLMSLGLINNYGRPLGHLMPQVSTEVLGRPLSNYTDICRQDGGYLSQ